MAITLFYFGNSFTGELPWGTCLTEWEADLKAANKSCISATEKSDGSDYGSTISSAELYFT